MYTVYALGKLLAALLCMQVRSPTPLGPLGARTSGPTNTTSVSQQTTADQHTLLDLSDVMCQQLPTEASKDDLISIASEDVPPAAAGKLNNLWR